MPVGVGQVVGCVCVSSGGVFGGGLMVAAWPSPCFVVVGWARVCSSAGWRCGWSVVCAGSAPRADVVDVSSSVSGRGDGVQLRRAADLVRGIQRRRAFHLLHLARQRRTGSREWALRH